MNAVKADKKAKTRDLEKTRRLILDAAAQEFAEYGFPGARVDRISRLAGCNKAMIYYIYKDKQELHLAVLENLFEEKVKEVKAHLDKDKSGLADLFPLLRGYLQTFIEKTAYARIVLYDIATGARTLRDLRKRRPDLFEELDVIADMLEGMGQAGLIHDIDPDKGVTLIVLIVIGLANMLPHMDLIAPPDSTRCKNLSDQKKWLAFLSDIFGRILQPDK